MKTKNVNGLSLVMGKKKLFRLDKKKKKSQPSDVSKKHKHGCRRFKSWRKIRQLVKSKRELLFYNYQGGLHDKNIAEERESQRQGQKPSPGRF